MVWVIFCCPKWYEMVSHCGFDLQVLDFILRLAGSIGRMRGRIEGRWTGCLSSKGPHWLPCGKQMVGDSSGELGGADSLDKDENRGGGEKLSEELRAVCPCSEDEEDKESPIETWSGFFFFSDMVKGLHAFFCSEALSTSAGLGLMCSNTEAWGLPWWSSARGMGLIPGQGNKIPHAMWHGQIIIILFKASFKKTKKLCLVTSDWDSRSLKES